MTRNNELHSPDQSGFPPPWYRQFWPWFLFALPASAVVAGIATIIIAVNNPDGLVEDDYYKAGLAINRTLERQQRAQELGLQAEIHWQTDRQGLELHLSAPPAATPSRLILRLIHPTRSGFDVRIPLLQQGSGQYRGLIPTPPIAGRWNLILEPEDASWRLSGRASLPQDNDWKLAP